MRPETKASYSVSIDTVNNHITPQIVRKSKQQKKWGTAHTRPAAATSQQRRATPQRQRYTEKKDNHFAALNETSKKIKYLGEYLAVLAAHCPVVWIVVLRLPLVDEGLSSLLDALENGVLVFEGQPLTGFGVAISAA